MYKQRFCILHVQNRSDAPVYIYNCVCMCIYKYVYSGTRQGGYFLLFCITYLLQI